LPETILEAIAYHGKVSARKQAKERPHGIAVGADFRVSGSFEKNAIEEKSMRNIGKMLLMLALLLAAASDASPQAKSPSQDEKTSLVVVFNDGRQQTFATTDLTRIEFKGGVMIFSVGEHGQNIPMSEIARIEFNRGPANTSATGRGRFVGKWKVGQGNGEYFYITLERSGEANKSLGAHHGTWTVVDGEARISWDDGWHDAIRKKGTRFEKVAFEPGKTFSDAPANVTDAQNTSAEPI
jgi:hypothetical protein